MTEMQLNSYIRDDTIIEKYEELRTNIVEKSTSKATGFAAFMRNGLLSWGFFLEESSRKVCSSEKSNFKPNTRDILDNPVISVLANMIDSIQREAYL